MPANGGHACRSLVFKLNNFPADFSTKSRHGYGGRLISAQLSAIANGAAGRQSHHPRGTSFSRTAYFERKVRFPCVEIWRQRARIFDLDQCCALEIPKVTNSDFQNTGSKQSSRRKDSNFKHECRVWALCFDYRALFGFCVFCLWKFQCAALASSP